MTAPTEDLIARLEKRRSYGSEFGLMPEQLPRPTLVNPDGPAAAQALRSLQAEVERLRGDLAFVRDKVVVTRGPMGSFYRNESSADDLYLVHARARSALNTGSGEG